MITVDNRKDLISEFEKGNGKVMVTGKLRKQVKIVMRTLLFFRIIVVFITFSLLSFNGLHIKMAGEILFALFILTSRQFRAAGSALQSVISIHTLDRPPSILFLTYERCALFLHLPPACAGYFDRYISGEMPETKTRSFAHRKLQKSPTVTKSPIEVQPTLF